MLTVIIALVVGALIGLFIRSIHSDPFTANQALGIAAGLFCIGVVVFILLGSSGEIAGISSAAAAISLFATLKRRAKEQS